MARALLGHKLRRLSLEAVAEHLGLGVKGTAIASVLGMRRADIIANGMYEGFKNYAANDVFLLRRLFEQLAPDFPRDEYRVMDLVLRCCVQPRFVMNVEKLQQHYTQVVQDKEELIAACGYDKTQLMSSAEFARILESHGVTVETKLSDAGNEIPALAKSDEFMKDLEELSRKSTGAGARRRASRREVDIGGEAMRKTLSDSEIAVAFGELARRYDADTFALFRSAYAQTVRRLENQHAKSPLWTWEHIVNAAGLPRGAAGLQGDRLRSGADRSKADRVADAQPPPRDVQSRTRTHTARWRV